MDSLNFSLAVDNYIAKELENLSPHKSVFGLGSPYKVEDTISIPKPVVSTISNWIESETTFDPAKLQQMQQLLS